MTIEEDRHAKGAPIPPRPPTYVHAHGIRGWIIPLAESVLQLHIHLGHDDEGVWHGRVLFQVHGAASWPIEAVLAEGDVIALARHYSIDVDQPKAQRRPV